MPADPSGVAVVSGASSGLGRAMALALAKRGHPIVLLGRRADALREVLALAGGTGLALACDVRQPDQVDRAAAQVLERYGSVEVVVPAAGVAHIAALEATDPEVFSRVVGTNLDGTFLLLRALLPAMRRRGRGYVIPLLSVAARRGFPGWSAYCASKWGLAGLVAALREELVGSGIRVTALYPGATDTPIWEGMPGDWNRDRMIPAAEVVRAMLFALDADDTVSIDELHINPAGGAQ